MVMENSNQQINSNTFVELLKACAKKKDICRGTQIHANILKRGLLEKSPYLATTLISMYAKCGELGKAREVLDDLHVRDVVSWNALISEYARQWQGHEALSCFEKMQQEGISPDGVTFTCILKACGSIRAIDKGKQIHDEIVSRELLEKHVILGNALVDMYAKCGMLVKALEVLKGLPERSVVTWSSVIAGYAQKGQGHEALSCFEEMQKDGISPDEVTFISILKACGCIGAIDRGTQIHCEIVKKGLLDQNDVLGNALVGMYAKCGLLGRAREMLEVLSVRDVVSWSTLIAEYVQDGQDHEALICYEHMQNEGVHSNEVTFICMLNACGNVGDIEKGKTIHDEIINRGFLGKNVQVGNALVSMYAKCGLPAKAQKVFDQLSARDVVSWSSLIAGYAQEEQGFQALNCFEQMQEEGIPPNEVTFISVLKTCGSINAIDKGKQIHEEILAKGLLKHNNIVLGNALVEMYTNCRELAKAREVVKELPVRNTVSWNLLIAGYAQEGQAHEALNCFECMKREGFFPNEITFTCILKACSCIGAIDNGKVIHNELVCRGLLKGNIVLGNSLVDMYAKCCLFEEADHVVEALFLHNVVSWSALIAGYAQDGQSHEALKCFARMQREGISPNEITFASILKACGSIGAIDKGKQIHDDIANAGLLKRNIVLGTALVDMYAKCGMLLKAQEVLEELSIRNVVSWNALLGGYAQEGNWHEALNVFERMQKEGLFPNEITFLGLLNSFAHSGKLDEAKLYYEDMSTIYGIASQFEHYACMMIICGCLGCFEKAMSVIKMMPSSDDPSVWLALLGTCRKWENVKLGRLAFDQLILLDNNLGAAYVLMAKIYKNAGMHEDAKEVEEMNPACKNQGIHI